MEKSLRLKANIGEESVVHVQVKKDVDMFEMLSLSLSTEGIYKRHSSNYGVIIGRVVVNGGVGVPNAKISVFVPLKSSDALRPEIKALYPYKNVTDTDSDGRRYNLLPMSYNDNVHVAVGSFPSSQAVLDNDIYLEIYEKYYKYTTVTNESGDYMLYGVPTGTQTIHMDVDISDIGYLSQKPYHMIDKGYSSDMFDSPTRFKGGTNLDLLPQLFTENEVINVYPFWGDEDEDEIAITRKDFELQYEIVPTCMFMGSVVTDADENYISEGCTISEKLGDMSQLRPSEGKIEIMRYTPSGDIEEYVLKDNKLIDGNGVFCFQVPMNLNYVTTTEDGKLVRSEDPTNGIPTTARVRFRMTLEGEGEDIAASHSMSYLIPNNPESSPEENSNGFVTLGEYQHDVMAYATFGNSFEDDEIKEDCFRDLLWNCVYSVKNYIPRVELRDGDEGEYYIGNGLQHTGIKGVNKSGATSKNPFPYNKMNLSTSFLTWYTSESINQFLGKADREAKWYYIQIFPFLSRYFKYFKAIRNFFFNGETYEAIQNEDEIFARNLEDTDGISFDFYNDWINGCLYFPKVKYELTSEMCNCAEEVHNLGLYYNTKYEVNDTCALDYFFGTVTNEDRMYRFGDVIYSTSTQNTDDLIRFNKYGDNTESAYYLTTDRSTRRCIKNSIYDSKIGNWKWMGLNQEIEGAPNTFNYRVASRRITNGLTVKKEGTLDKTNIQFSYAPLFFFNNGTSGNTFNGFKTDIILLGAIDDTNFHGIQSINGLKLPKTTATLVQTYRTDASGKNYTGDFSTGPRPDEGGYTELNTGDWVVYENQLNFFEVDEQNGNESKSGSEINPSNAMMQSSLQRTNGSFWGSTEHANYIKIGGRYIRYWLPWNRLSGSFLTTTKTVDSSLYFSKQVDNGDWDKGKHCLLGGGLFFGRSRMSLFQNNYVTKPKTCINLNRICELSVGAENSMTFPDKNSRSDDIGSNKWVTNIQFQFMLLPNNAGIPTVDNVIGDTFWKYEGNDAYHSEQFCPSPRTIAEDACYNWVSRPPISAKTNETIWVSSRIINLDDKGNTSTRFWKYQEPCIWFKWGYNAHSTTEYEYVFVITPSGITDAEIVTTYVDEYGQTKQWEDAARRVSTDRLYCPKLRYKYNGTEYVREFTNQQGYFDGDNDDFVQWVSMREKGTNEWGGFSSIEEWNIRDWVDDGKYHATPLESEPFLVYCNSPAVIRSIPIDEGPMVEYVYTTSEEHPSYTYYYSTPNYPKEYTWGKDPERDTYFLTIMTNEYGIMGGTLDDGSDNLPQKLYIKYINCGMSGIIGDEDISDFTNRSLFATMNANKLKLVEGDDDKSKTPVRRYNNPNKEILNISGFDGFLTNSVLKEYHENGIEEGIIKVMHYENSSHDYAHFRYGDNPKFNVKVTGEGVDRNYKFPVYENSFYFYFGINSSQTALHKLKTNFM